MGYTDLIFDLYGTLVDIHTEEDALVWEKTALFFGYYGAHFTGESLREAFNEAMAARQAKAGQNYECFPDIPFEEVMAELFRSRCITNRAEELGIQAAQLFRISSTEYLRLYPGVTEALQRLRDKGCRLWLLSNAQRIFTAYELRHLGLGAQFDAIYISSDHRCRKPDSRFFRALLEEQQLEIPNCLMIGNDLQTDIGGARAVGLDTLYMHTELTPPDQRKAAPTLDPRIAPAGTHHYEYEGDNWQDLIQAIETLL